MNGTHDVIAARLCLACQAEADQGGLLLLHGHLVVTLCHRGKVGGVINILVYIKSRMRINVCRPDTFLMHVQV